VLSPADIGRVSVEYQSVPLIAEQLPTTRATQSTGARLLTTVGEGTRVARIITTASQNLALVRGV